MVELERSDDTADDSATLEQDVGPDPIWALGLFIVGLFVMAIGGAATWHWVFNVGEGLLLVGVGWFLAAVAITRLKQDPLDWRSKLPQWLGGTGEAPTEPAEPKPRRKKKSKKKKKRRAARAAKRTAQVSDA